MCRIPTRHNTLKQLGMASEGRRVSFHSDQSSRPNEAKTHPAYNPRVGCLQIDAILSTVYPVYLLYVSSRLCLGMMTCPLFGHEITPTERVRRRPRWSSGQTSQPLRSKVTNLNPPKDMFLVQTFTAENAYAACEFTTRHESTREQSFERLSP